MDFPKRFVCATHEICNEYKHVNAPVFRKSFTIRNNVKKAEILICGLGFYDLFLNGEKITKGFLAPYISNPDDITYYDYYDFTNKLKDGENVIGVVLGNGTNNALADVWLFRDTPYTSSPRFAASINIECENEKLSFEASDFLCNDSPITFDNLRYGVRYDARLEQSGWCEAGFDDSSWKKPLDVTNPPRGEAKLCEAEPITITERRAAISCKKGTLAPFTCSDQVAKFQNDFPCDQAPGTGGYIYDFGINSAGVFSFKINNAKPGQVISFQCGEYLDDEGRLFYSNISFFPDGYGQRDIYICKGGKEEVFVPMFTYHGFRYVYVYGLENEQAQPDTLTYLVMSSRLDKRADFNCSSQIVNSLWKAAMNSDLSNFYYFPTDCPHREKNGWTGDAAASSEHMIMTLSVENSWREWLCNIRAAQNKEGALPGIVPTAGWGFDWGNGPAWDRVLFDLPYMAYIYRGDKDIIRENSHAMMSYLEYISKRRDSDGIICIGLGDWVPIGGYGNPYRTPLAFTDSVMTYDMCVKAEKMFLAIGNTLNASYAKQLGTEIKASVREHFIDLENMITACSSQSGISMAIYYDIFEPSEKVHAAKNLARLVRACEGNVECGYLGLRVIFHVLSQYGESELAYNMITKDEFPSYAYYINMGLTSLPENFEREKVQCSSLNHHFLGDINHWFLRRIVGINVNPHGDDPNRITIKPNFIESLDFAEGRYDAPNGSVYVKWSRENENIILTVKADDGIKCDIRTPDSYRLDDKHGRQAYTVCNNALLNVLKWKNCF